MRRKFGVGGGGKEKGPREFEVGVSVLWMSLDGGEGGIVQDVEEDEKE